MRRLELVLAFVASVGAHAAVLLPGSWHVEAAVPLRQGDSAVAIELVASVESRAARPPDAPAPPPVEVPSPPPPHTEMTSQTTRVEPAPAPDILLPAEAADQALHRAAPWLASAEMPRPVSPPATGMVGPVVPAAPAIEPLCPVGPPAVVSPPHPRAPADAGHVDSRASDGGSGVRGVSTAARVDGTIETVYPLISRRRGEEGSVVLQWRVLPDGRADEIRVLRSSGYRRLDEAAVHAVREGDFRPATEDGRPVASTVTRTWTFRLTDSDF